MEVDFVIALTGNLSPRPHPLCYWLIHFSPLKSMVEKVTLLFVNFITQTVPVTLILKVHCQCFKGVTLLKADSESNEVLRINFGSITPIILEELENNSM